MTDITHCKTCLMPSTRPRMVMTEGVCNACLNAVAKQEVDWPARAIEFASILENMRAVQDGPYHCVVPFSGGKDSAAIALKLKKDFGLNPLLVCYGQLLWTDVGRHNFERVRRHGFDIVNFQPNGRVQRELARQFFIERGHPKQHYDAGVNATPLRVAQAFGIKTVWYAEHGESEYGGHVRSVEATRTRDLDEVLENQVGDDPRNWVRDGISEADLAPYIMPQGPAVNFGGFDGISSIPLLDITAYYWSYFHKWDTYENYTYCRDELGFKGEISRDWTFSGEPPFPLFPDLADHTRSDGTFVGWDSIDDMIDDLDFYMMHIKFGFGRATRQACRLIQNGHMTRDEGLFLARLYDGELPTRYMPQILDYLKMDMGEFTKTVDMHRNPEIWENKTRGDVWTLRHPPA